jgi:hypothetical protein
MRNRDVDRYTCPVDVNNHSRRCHNPNASVNGILSVCRRITERSPREARATDEHLRTLADVALCASHARRVEEAVGLWQGYLAEKRRSMAQEARVMAQREAAEAPAREAARREEEERGEKKRRDEEALARAFADMDLAIVKYGV